MGCLPSKSEAKPLLQGKQKPNYTNMSEGDLKKMFESRGQGHALKFLDELDAKQKAEFLAQLRGLDLDYCLEVFERSTKEAAEGVSSLSPFPQVDSLQRTHATEIARWAAFTYQAIAKGEVAFILLAGGQGTRLGSSDPKGMYNIGLPSNKPLFQLQAERLLRLQELSKKENPDAKGTIQWYVMTSPATHAPTEAFFKANKFFGLKSSQVFFFQQAMFPCFDLNGKLMLDTKGRVATSPDGNGGIYKALHASGALKDMEKKGVRYTYACSVDNALAKVCDPAFMGYCMYNQADCGVKVVPKAYADEKIGVICLRNNKTEVVEYSDMSAEDSSKVDKDGQLVFNTGNICIHYYSREFLERAHQLKLPYHVARKKIGFVSESGDFVTPQDISGMKMEQFIFDVFPFAKRMVVLEGDRSEDFAPVKNAPGSDKDSPDTARAMVSALHKKWAVAAGATFVGEEDGLFEISPLVSYGGEDLEGKFPEPIALPHCVQ